MKFLNRRKDLPIKKQLKIELLYLKGWILNFSLNTYRIKLRRYLKIYLANRRLSKKQSSFAKSQLAAMELFKERVGLDRRIRRYRKIQEWRGLIESGKINDLEDDFTIKDLLNGNTEEKVG